MTQVAGDGELNCKAGRKPQNSNIQLWLQVCWEEGRRKVLPVAEALSDDQKPMGSGGRTDRTGLAEFSMSPEEGRWPELTERC